MNYIIGAGINGLIAGYYLKDYKIIGIPKENQLNSDFPLGVRVLQVSKSLQKLLEELNLPTTKRKLKIGYYYDNSLHSNLSKSLSIEYLQKTRGNEDFISSCLSEGKKILNIFEVTPQILYNKLLGKADKIIFRKVFKILPHHHIIRIKEEQYKGCPYLIEMQYEKLISTIPAYSFYELVGKKTDQFKVKAKYFYLILKTLKTKEYDYVYFPEKDTIISRISNYGKDYQILETTKDMIGTNLPYSSDINLPIRRAILPKGQIVSKVNLKQFPGVKFIGRYACWRHEKKINEIIEDTNDIGGISSS